MKTALIGENINNIKRVFSKDVLDYLLENAGYDGKVYSKEQIFENKELFVDTEFVFSTWGMPSLSEEEIKELLPSLKAVFYSAGTVQYFARPFLNSGVKVISAWAANAVPVAEYTVAQIILANKGFFKASNPKNTKEFSEKHNNFLLFGGNYGANIGIIGAGMIGKLVINMLKLYNLNIFVFDPFLPDEKAKELGVKKVSLNELFSKCNVVSNHLANNEQTKGMLSGELFKLLPKNATFLNTGRGAQVVENDLISVLEKRPDIMAILDVTEPEPPIEKSKLYSLCNCILTPHIAGSSGKEVERMSEYMLEEYKRFISNRETRYEVNLKMLETMA